MTLEGKVAIVTGSARGIGRAIALRLARLGADIVVADINLASSKDVREALTADTVMDEIEALGRRSIGIPTDVTSKASVNAMFDRVRQEFGHIDILVNNAGGSRGRSGPLMGGSADVSEEDMRRLIDLNLMAAIFCCQAATPSFVAQKSGVIVNMASFAGLTLSLNLAFAGHVPYGAAKAGVIHYTRILARELGPHGIRVNCIAPGAITTGNTLSYRKTPGYGGSEDTFMDRCPLRRRGNPEDIARVVEFLCTDLSGYVTGQCIRVDGGLTLF